MKKDLWVPIIIGFVLIALLVFASRTMSIVLVFIPAIIIAFIVYLSTAYKNAPEPSKILVPYLLALSVQCLHFAEEYVTGFYKIIPAVFGQPELPLDHWVIFNMVAYCLFILGGLAFYKKQKMFMIIPLVFIVAGVFFNTIAHILTSIIMMEYMPGLITVFLYIPLIPIFLKALKQPKLESHAGQ